MTNEQDIAAAYEEDAQLTAGEADNILSQITNTVREYREAQAEVVHVEAMLRAAQDRVKSLVEVQLPQLMDEAKQKRLTTLDGFEVERSEVIRASISAENAPTAFSWLRANGQSAIIKRELKLTFGKGEEAKAEEATQVLKEHHMEPEAKESVHPQTLGALVRELLAEGKEFPADAFGVFVQPVVKVKPTKK